MTVLMVALGAALGAPARFALSHLLDDELPVGTLLANVLGSTLLGFLTAVGPGEQAVALVGVGFCGGFTTWSSMAVQAHDRGRTRGTGYLALTLVLAIAGCAVGFLAGAQL